MWRSKSLLHKILNEAIGYKIHGPVQSELGQRNKDRVWEWERVWEVREWESEWKTKHKKQIKIQQRINQQNKVKILQITTYSDQVNRWKPFPHHCYVTASTQLKEHSCYCLCLLIQTDLVITTSLRNTECVTETCV